MTLRKIFITAAIISMAMLPKATLANGGFSSSESQLCERYFSIYEKKYTLPAKLLKAISTQESGRWSKERQRVVPWPWTINAQGKGYYFASKSEAIEKVRELQSQGVESIDVGCMQINLRYHPEAFQNLNQAFNPKDNIAYSGKLLRDHYENKASWKSAVASYHTGAAATNSENGRNYAKKVLATWRNEIDEMIARSKQRSLSFNTTPSPKSLAASSEEIKLVKLDHYPRTVYD